MSCTITFAGQQVEMQPEGVLWFPELRLLCAADIHFEKGTFFQRFATFLPPYDTRATLARLAEIIARLQPDRFIALGDSFHDRHAVSRMQPEDKEFLRTLIGSVRDWIWVQGNHDPEIALDIPGSRTEEYQHGNIRFRHELEQESADWEISGHYHPKARVSVRGHGISGPCFLRMGNRLILPSFGSYTGGLDIFSREFRAIAPSEPRSIYLVHQSRVYAV
ncbi:MAG: ligase-associated DNA damage response endonuclease PdeM [Rickettsiales bacterium]